MPDRLAMPSITLAVPAFARLDEFVGPWAYEPTRFAAQFAAIGGVNLAEHKARQPKSSVDRFPGQRGKDVAVVRIAGTMMKQASSMGGTSTIQLRRDIRQAANDPDVSGILMSIDSPGGTVAGTMDLVNEISQARRKKPVWAHVDDHAFSAAFWAASLADFVFVNNETAAVGSIGTLMWVYDMSAMAEKEGVKTFVFTTGPLKAFGLPGAPVTEDQAADAQAHVNELQRHFDAGVQKGRGLTDKQLAAVRTGGVFTATDAQAKKLIDGIQSFETTLRQLAAAK